MIKQYAQFARPLIILFVLVNALLITFQETLEAKNISTDVVIAANLLLFFISMLNIYFQAKNRQNNNPRAAVRYVMAGTMLKLVLVATAILIYLSITGKDRNKLGVFAGMGLYVIYTLLEVRISLRMNPKK